MKNLSSLTTKLARIAALMLLSYLFASLVGNGLVLGLTAFNDHLEQRQTEVEQ